MVALVLAAIIPAPERLSRSKFGVGLFHWSPCTTSRRYHSSMHITTVLSNCFSTTAGGVFLATALLKLAVLSSQSTELRRQNPLLNIDNSQVILLAVFVEIAVSIYLFLQKDERQRLWMIACFTSSLLAYQIALRAAGGKPNCGCFGVATEWIPYLGRNESKISLVLLVLMLVGSTFLL